MKIIIAGAGEVGSHLAKMLSNEANDITVIDERHERLDIWIFRLLHNKDFKH